MYNPVGNLIRKWFKMDGIYHCLVQDLQGRIYHEKFVHEQDMLDFMDSFISKPEYLNNVK